ncbi:hypothetical protein, partial [Actinocorallia lasiicapitis]
MSGISETTPGPEFSELMAGAAFELSTVDLNDCVTAILRLVLRYLADRAAVVLPDDDGGFTAFRTTADGRTVRDACAADPGKEPEQALALLEPRGTPAVLPLG